MKRNGGLKFSIMLGTITALPWLCSDISHMLTSLAETIPYVSELPVLPLRTVFLEDLTKVSVSIYYALI